MTDESLTAKITELMDREAIRDGLFKYCRGIDRADEALLRAAYWPDAIDSHGPYNGPVDGFVEWAKTIWASKPRNIHMVSNILIEFQTSTTAHVESYFTALQRGKSGDGVTRQFMLCGRYCDVFEKRGDEWRVLDRLVVYDWVEPQDVPADDETTRFGPRLPIGGSYPDDPVYRMGRSTGD
jgi:hypothetical protein